MSLTQTSHRHSEQGFTLVELAIVMVIIGLLIGGILKGQELIANAKISATVSQLKGLDAALNTFQDKYNGLPGDIINAKDRLQNCTTAPCNDDGDGNGRYTNQAGAAPALTSEGVVAFSQLSAADLISGINSAADGTNPSFGGSLPAVKAGGGMWLGSSTSAGAGSNISGLTGSRAYASLNGTNEAVSGDTGAFSPTVAAQIDRKIDDGVPDAGGTHSVCSSGGISSSLYVESLATATCAMYVRVLN